MEIRRSHGAEVVCYGVNPSRVHQIGMDLVRQTRTGGLALAMELADPLWRSSNLEESMVATQILGAQGRHISGVNFERFDQWAGTATTRIAADGIGLQLVSKAMAAKPSLAARLLEWAKSPHKERRRAAVMAFAPLVREGRFLSDALLVVEQIMLDDDLNVQDAASHVLFEASRMQGERVFEFLKQWRGKAPRDLLDKAAQKLPEAQRGELLNG